MVERDIERHGHTTGGDVVRRRLPGRPVRLTADRDRIERDRRDAEIVRRGVPDLIADAAARLVVDLVVIWCPENQPGPVSGAGIPVRRSNRAAAIEREFAHREPAARLVVAHVVREVRDVRTHRPRMRGPCVDRQLAGHVVLRTHKAVHRI